MSEILATSPAMPGEAPTVEGRLADIIEADNAEIRIDDYRLSTSDRAKVVAALRLAAQSDAPGVVSLDDLLTFARQYDGCTHDSLCEMIHREFEIRRGQPRSPRVSDLQTSTELLALIDRAKNHVMSAEEIYEQRRSFIRGMCPSNRDYKGWCETVDKMFPPLSDTRPDREG